MTLSPEPPERDDRKRFDMLAQFALVILGIFLVYRLFQPIIPALLWGVFLAIILAHPYERVVSRVGGKRGAVDILFAFALVLIFLVPVLVFAWELVSIMPNAVERSTKLAEEGLPQLPSALSGAKVVGPALESLWERARQDSGGTIREIASHAGVVASWLVARLGSFGTLVLEFALGGVISLYLLHNRFAVRAFLARGLSRVGGSFANRLVLGAFETTRNAFAGVVAAALAQTILAALALVVLGVPGVAILAGLTFVMALVQIGPLLVLVIAVTVALAQGHIITAIVLTAWFLGVVMTVDNVIRPYFTSRRGEIPWLLAFLGTIGGLFSWGLIGVFVGPVLVSMIFAMLIEWANEDSRNTQPDE